MHFIFGLRPEIMRLVYVAQPATILAAKTMAEKLELTQLATLEPYPHTKKQKTSKAQHSGTQERRSSVRHRKKAQSTVTQQRKMKTTRLAPAQSRGCTFAQTGAIEASCPDGYGPAAVWRSYAKDLPLGDRAGYMRRQGSIMEIDLEALTRRKEETSADVTEAHQPSAGLKAP